MNAAVAITLAVIAGYGAFLLYTAVVLGWRGYGVSPIVGPRPALGHRLRAWMVQAGMEELRPVELGAAGLGAAVVGAGAAYAIFGGVAAPAAVGVCAATVPGVAARARRRRRRDAARESWPRLIEEIRLQATTMGRSLPHALAAAGRRAPDDLRPAFAAAEREWVLTTDFERMVAVLKARLADTTADAVCETLLVAAEVGGSDVDERLRALIDDRIADLQGRKDAVSKQAGARFARWFVLAVPVGMALAGLTIGDGRAAYATTSGQALVVAGLAMIAVCWVWASRIMRLPEEQRVFDGSPEAS